MVLYFAKTNAGNLLLVVDEEIQKAKYWHGNSNGISPDGIDLYADNSVEQFTELYLNDEIDAFDNMTGDFDNEIIHFDAEEFESLIEVCRR